MLKRLIKSNWPVLAITFLVTILIFFWFNDKKFIAGGEEGLSIWNAHKLYMQFQTSWYEVGTGMPAPLYLPRVTLYFLASLLSVFFPIWLVQAICFWFLMVTGSLSVFFLANNLTGRKSIAAVAGFFYLFNLYSQSSVWERFIYSGFFNWTFLPLFLFLWVKVIKTKRIRWVFIMILSSLIFSDVFTQPAFILTIWVPAILFILTEVWHCRHDLREVLQLLAWSGCTIIVWVIASFWWLYPLIKLGNSSFPEVSDWNANLGSLDGVSKYFPIPQILLLRQSYLFGNESTWFDFYSTLFVYSISVSILIIAFIGWKTCRLKRYKLYLTILALTGLFISKGTNFPLGHIIFEWLFKNFSFLGVLRNSYEKFGVVWLLPYAFFFAFGLDYIFKFNKSNRRVILTGTALMLFCGYLVWPMWTGNLFKNARINVPIYYKELNTFLNQDKSDGKVLMLPLISGVGTSYNWNYQGIEPSEFLFDKPAVSRMIGMKYYDDKYINLYHKFAEGQNYDFILKELNIKYLVLHYDLDSKASGASSSAEVKSILEKNNNVSFLAQFGDLAVYQFLPTKDGGLFALEGNNIPEISYYKLSPAHYKVAIKGASRSYILIFKSTFSRFWEAKIANEKIYGHFLIYDYANSWNVDRIGDYTIDIIFKVLPWD